MVSEMRTNEGRKDWLLVAGFFSAAMATYAGIGYALYLLVT